MTAVADIDLTDQQHIVLEDVSWELYDRLVEELGESHIRITYDNGRMEMMPPLPKHEKWGWRFGRFVADLCLEKNIAFAPGGSTTFRKKAKKIGLEPDECFYIKDWETANNIDGPWNPALHPAPDLAIEIDITSRSIDNLPIYAGLGIAEVWRFDGRKLHVLILDDDERYREQGQSKLFPFLPMDQLVSFARRFDNENHIVVIRAFQDWARSLPQ